MVEFDPSRALSAPPVVLASFRGVFSRTCTRELCQTRDWIADLTDLDTLEGAKTNPTSAASSASASTRCGRNWRPWTNTVQLPAAVGVQQRPPASFDVPSEGGLLAGLAVRSVFVFAPDRTVEHAWATEEPLTFPDLDAIEAAVEASAEGEKNRFVAAATRPRMDIVEALHADSGTTCVVGAGGKKTTLYRLATRLDRAVVTATVRIPIFDSQVERVVVTDDPATAVENAAPEDFPLGVVPEQEREDRYRGFDPARVDDLSAAHDGPVLVKADGARTREFKAPNEDEPQIPERADTVVPIASVHALGHPLDDERVHRPEEVAALAGIEEGEEITPKVMATVLSSPAGGLKGVPSDATAIPMLNKVDNASLRAEARKVAVGIKQRADVPHVVLAQMNASDEPLGTTV